MKNRIRLALGAAAVLLVSAWVAPLAAGADPIGGGADHVVFVQTDNPAGNQVVAYQRADDGTLTLAATYSTGGLGGVLNGSAADHLASQGSLTYDSANSLLYAVNAGSNTISVFSVSGDGLALRQVLNSGGTFPVSVAVHRGLVYVLNAFNGASVSGFRAAGGVLHVVQGSTRALGLTIPSDTSQFTHTPGQLAFSPDGSQLVVTTKANTNAIDVFSVGPDGRLGASPQANIESGTVPFAVSFDNAGHLVVANAGTNGLATYSLAANGSVSLIDAVGTGQSATCWIASAQGFLYASNAASATVSGFGDASDGTLSLLNPPTSTDLGTVDASASAGGQYLYVQTGKSGIVDEFQVSASGSLTSIGSVTVADSAGGEGIAAV